MLTNHHVARGQLQKLSTQQKDYVQEGFLARNASEELACPDLELNVLMSMEDVTAKVAAAVKQGMSEKDAFDARKAAIGRLEKESLDATGLRSDVVSLYQGSEYWVYRYKKYTDIRIVFAPEVQAAFFGGDPDNFTFPRHDLDMAIFRVYENGKAVNPAHFLKWNPKGAADGDLVFVSGHPGSTQRLSTVAQIEFTRDLLFPNYLKRIRHGLEVARGYAARGKEEKRQVDDSIFYMENSLKAINGELDSIKAAGTLAKKKTEEVALRRGVEANPEWKKAYGSAWEDTISATKKYSEFLKPLTYRRATGMKLGEFAKTLVRYVAEIAKPDGERLEEFHEAGLESLRFELLSPAPIYPALEETLLADQFRTALNELGPDDPWLQIVLEGRKPEDVAKYLISGTKLSDPAIRKALLDGGSKAIAESTDPLIVLALKLDPMGRSLRKNYEDMVESKVISAGEKIGKARFAVYGKNLYPDATFTLRLSFGTVKGYPMNGTVAPSKTTYYGLFDRAASFDYKAPFDLPKRYLERKGNLDLSTPLDFVSDTDIIGGNSGSPVVNREGELVGLVFDGNIESFAGDFVYDPTANRTVSVHSAAMTEALRKLYDAEYLVNEMLGRP